MPYRLAYDGRWHVDVDSLRNAVSRRTRAIVTVSPNNPTGSYLKHDELAALSSLGLPIVSDEVFASYPLREDPTRATTALEAQGALVFSLGGLSKLAGLPQMKLAWIVVGGDAPDVTDAMARLEVLADAYLSVGTPVQHALPHLLASRVPAESAIQSRTRANLELLRSRVSGTAGTLLDVEGGWYATLRVPATRSEESWVLELLEEDGVHVHPGHFFDFEREAYLVVSLLTPPPSLEEGVRRIVARVASG